MHFQRLMRAFHIRLKLILLISLTLAVFQNCGSSEMKSSTLSTESASQEEEKVVDSTTSYSRIIYDQSLEGLPYGNFQPPRLDLNLERGTLSLDIRSQQRTFNCQIDAARLAALRDLMASSKICVPTPPPPGMNVCMAMGVADIELVGAGKSTLLRPPICFTGRFLCAGADEKLRELLSSLRDTPPANCQ